MKLSKKLLLVPVVIAALTVGFALSENSGRAAADGDATSRAIVGAWEVTADAPYPPHLFTFHADGTMSTTNPTNVQENASDPRGGTNDSLGMGTWKAVNENGTKYVVGTFEQLNAYADNHQPTDKLSVSFKIKVKGNELDGPAQAKLGAFTVPSHLHGTKIAVDQAAVDNL